MNLTSLAANGPSRHAALPRCNFLPMVQFDLPHHVNSGGMGHGFRIEAAGRAKVCQEGKRSQSRKQRRQQLQDFLHSNGFTDDVTMPRPTKGGCLFFPKPRVYPIHVAAHAGDHEVVHLLLQAKADPRQMTSKQRTAEDIALEADKEGSHREVLELLQNRVHVVNFREALDLMQQDLTSLEA